MNRCRIPVRPNVVYQCSAAMLGFLFVAVGCIFDCPSAHVQAETLARAIEKLYEFDAPYSYTADIEYVEDTAELRVSQTGDFYFASGKMSSKQHRWPEQEVLVLFKNDRSAWATYYAGMSVCGVHSGFGTSPREVLFQPLPETLVTGHTSIPFGLMFRKFVAQDWFNELETTSIDGMLRKTVKTSARGESLETSKSQMFIDFNEAEELVTGFGRVDASQEPEHRQSVRLSWARDSRAGKSEFVPLRIEKSKFDGFDETRVNIRIRDFQHTAEIPFDSLDDFVADLPFGTMIVERNAVLAGGAAGQPKYVGGEAGKLEFEARKQAWDSKRRSEREIDSDASQ